MRPSDISRWQGSVNSWLAQGWVGGVYTLNPAANVIFADTGELVAGWYDFKIIISCTATIIPFIRLQHRDLTNTVTIATHAFPMQAYRSIIFDNTNYYMAVSERLRILTTSGITGYVGASIIHKLRI